MSIWQPTLPPRVPPEADPFRYGRRPVYHRGPDGRVRIEHRPLTFEDWLHPEEGDELTVTDRHQREIHYLWSGLEIALRRRPEALVLCNIDVYWQRPDLPRNHRPDLMVLFNVPNWHEGASY